MHHLWNIFKSPDDSQYESSMAQFFTCITSCGLPNSLKMIPTLQLQKLSTEGSTSLAQASKGLSGRGRAQTWEHLV